jgi:hypothetical protein
MSLIKPSKQNAGDAVAKASISAGKLEKQFRYYQGKKRLEEIFGLRFV